MLFKLLIFFKTVNLNGNNSRKCFLRPRKDIATHYSGLIYFQNLLEAKQARKYLKKTIAEEIDPEIPIFIKRGCSEFGKAHPSYAKLNENYSPEVKYIKKWKKIEDSFDRDGLARHLPPITADLFGENGFTNIDCLVMHAWLSYAKTIGDESYLKITDSSINVYTDIDFAPFGHK